MDRRVLRARRNCVVVGADISNISLTIFACRAEKGKMEQEDACVEMKLQDALELLPQEMHSKIVPAARTFRLRRTSKTMRAAVHNAKLDVVVVRRSGVTFRNGKGLLDKLNGLNAWCRVTELRQQREREAGQNA